MLRASSQIPKANSTAQPMRNDCTTGSSLSTSMRGRSVPSVMPQPPTRGIGTACTLRGSGMSSNPSRGARRRTSGITSMLTATASVSWKNGFMSVGQVVAERRQYGAGKLSETAIGRRRGFVIPQRRDETHQRAVSAIAQHGVLQQIPLDEIFVGDIATALLEPVIHQLPVVAVLDDRTIDAQRRAVGAHSLHRM